MLYVYMPYTVYLYNMLRADGKGLPLWLDIYFKDSDLFFRIVFQKRKCSNTLNHSDNCKIMTCAMIPLKEEGPQFS